MKIGFNCSSFDLFHAGHVTMLKMEKELCDWLIVAFRLIPLSTDLVSKINQPKVCMRGMYKYRVVEYVNDRPGHDVRYSTSNKKIMTEIDWSPKTDIATGLLKTILHYENH